MDHVALRQGVKTPLGPTGCAPCADENESELGAASRFTTTGLPTLSLTGTTVTDGFAEI